jgi:hypothetical protein
MHIFIYPSQDTYINNSNKFQNKNFGIDEVLEVYASNAGKKTVYTDPNWHTPPLTASSYGNNGWLAYTTSSLFIYSGSKWYAFNLTSSVIPNTSFIANFTGRLSNVTTNPKKPLYISGSANYASGSFSGSMNITSYSFFTGSWSTGSFSGSVRVGSFFTKLKVNKRTYTTSPLTSSLTGTGSFKNLRGKLLGKSNTGIPCSSSFYSPVRAFNSGSFTGSFSGSNSKLYIETLTSSKLYYTDITNFAGYFKGKYSGSFKAPSTAIYLNYPEFSRTLIKFDLNTLSQSISKNEISSSELKFTLNLKACGMRNLPLNYSIYAYPISQSWENGNGRYADDGSQLGATWNNRSYSGSNLWYGNKITNSYQQVNYLLTSSYSSASFQNQGGTWYYKVPTSYTNKPKWICNSTSFPSLVNNGLICSQSFNYGKQSDISMDITQIVRSWLCGCIPNQGLMLLSSFEISTPPLQPTNGLLQFFSKDTNTIYSPYIDVGWNDTVFSTGSLKPVSSSIQNLITLQSLNNAYKAGSVAKIFVFARDKYPLKTFNKSYQQPAMVTPKYLPTSSYYMVKDAESEEVLINFDDYTKLSCDASYGNYFKLNTSGLPQERYLTVFIKVEYKDGTVDIVDTGKIFKITR